MLLINSKASAVIRELLDQPAVAADSGLRIHRGPDGQSELTVTRALTPEEGDQVIEDEGVRVFLGPNAAILLADSELDASIDTSGRVRFRVTPQL